MFSNSRSPSQANGEVMRRILCFQDYVVMESELLTNQHYWLDDTRLNLVWS